MTGQERNEIRVHEFNVLIFQLQLGLLPFVKTHGEFLDLFGDGMREKTGEYTAEDEEYAENLLVQYEKKNAPNPDKRKMKQ